MDVDVWNRKKLEWANSAWKKTEEKSVLTLGHGAAEDV